MFQDVKKTDQVKVPSPNGIQTIGKPSLRNGYPGAGRNMFACIIVKLKCRDVSELGKHGEIASGTTPYLKNVAG